MHLNLSPSFQKSLARLSKQEQGLVKQTVMDFLLDPAAAGFRLHPLNMREKRFHSISPNMDLRVIVLREGDRHVMMYVDHHDAAYRWAERRRVEAHPVTGAAQLVEMRERVEEARPLAAVADVPQERYLPPLFQNLTDEDLLRVGVPPDWIADVRRASQDDVMELVDHLPEEAMEALLEYVTSGELPAPAGPAAGADPFAHPDAQRRFRLVADEETLAQALERPWEEWLVFLHPSQRAAVERRHGGPARVTGAAGTGKSVVAMHRTAHLARESQGGQILLSTFSPILSGRLADGMDRLLGPGTVARARIFAAPLHLYAADLLADATGTAPRLVGAAEVHPLLDAALAESGEALSPAFIRAEWDLVVDFWGLRDWAAYRDVARTGRGGALTPRARQKVWSIVGRVLAALAERGWMTRGDVCDAARALLAARGARPFRHVVVDEAQDLGPRELRLVAALAAPGPQSMFFAGDIGQQIYRAPFSWIGCGVDVRGRSLRLRVNYRTSAQIRRFADRLLPAALTDGDGGREERGSVSLFTGPEPDVRITATAAEEAELLAGWLGGLLERGVEPGEIAILARTPGLLEDRAAPVLRRLRLTGAMLSDDGEAHRDEVALGTLQAGKGLEFRAVAVIGAEEGSIPLSEALDAADAPEGRETVLTRERHLLYVGCSRARETLLVTAMGKLTPFLTCFLND
jgi:hypothetical protein